MKNLSEEIENIEFITGPNFSYDLDREFDLISSNLVPDDKVLLKEDFDQFLDKGKFLVLNTFSGGLLFLKVSEPIEKIRINARRESRDFEVSVIFDTELRKTENIKYKPEVGKAESVEWNVGSILPSFYEYDKPIQIALLMVIGRIVKRICEYGRTKFAYMKIENEFGIELLIDGQVEEELKVEID